MTGTAPRSEIFSIATAILSIIAGTFRHGGSVEAVWSEQIERDEPLTTAGPQNAFRIPDQAFYASARDTPNYGRRSVRDLSVAMNGGAFLSGHRREGVIPALQPHSVISRAGAEGIRVVTRNITMPRGTGGAVGYWLTSELSSVTESQPTFGEASSSPKIVAAFAEVSRQLLLQSDADIVVPQILLAAAGVAVDKAALRGTGGGGEPMGILGTPGVHTVSGTSLGYAGIIEFQTDVSGAGAGGDPDTCAYIAPTAVAGLMKQRARFSGTDSPLWQGAIARGSMEGCRAFSTENMPAGAMVYGDFRFAKIIQWATASIEVDPFTKFKEGIVGIRLLLPIDVVFPHPAAFAVSTSIT